MGYQQTVMVAAAAARAAILNLDARYDRAYSSGDVAAWMETWKHSGPRLSKGGREFRRPSDGFDGGRSRLVTVDHDVEVDGVWASQRCVAILFPLGGGPAAPATGVFEDELIYERGGWYFSARSFLPDDAAVGVRAESVQR